jgi:hypothetical protein
VVAIQSIPGLKILYMQGRQKEAGAGEICFQTKATRGVNRWILEIAPLFVYLWMRN